MSKKTLSTTRTTIKWDELIARLDELEIKISVGNSKMGKIRSYNITGGASPYVRSDGMMLSDFKGSCDGVCEGCERDCYAVNGEKRFKTKQLNNAINYALAKADLKRWKELVIESIKGDKSSNPIRIHETGEFFSIEYMSAWLEIISLFPNRTFYTYTKHYDFVRELKAEILKLDNFRLNLSVFRGNLEVVRSEFPEFAMFVWDDSNIKGGEFEGVEIPHDTRCSAVNKHGKMNAVSCLQCGKCFKAEFNSKVIVCYDHSKRNKHI